MRWRVKPPAHWSCIGLALVRRSTMRSTAGFLGCAAHSSTACPRSDAHTLHPSCPCASPNAFQFQQPAPDGRPHTASHSCIRAVPSRCSSIDKPGVSQDSISSDCPKTCCLNAKCGAAGGELRELGSGPCTEVLRESQVAL